MDFGRSRHAFGIYVRRAVRLGLFSVCACRRPLACAGARFGTAGHFARSSVGRQDFTRLCVSYSIYFFFSFRITFSKVVCACAAFRPHSPQFRGENLAPTASDVLRNGVQSPGKHTGGPARASAGLFCPDACGLARSLMGRANFGSQATQVFWRTVVHAGAFFCYVVAGFSFLRVVF